MKACVYTVLLACVVATGYAQSCWNADVKPIHDECGEKMKKENPKDKDAENEFMFNCVMCKTEVVANDVLDFAKLEQNVDKYVVEGKRADVKKAINDCKKNYDDATENKVKAFFGCYGPKLYKEICPQ